MRSFSTGLKEFKGEHAFFKKIKKIFYLLASEHLFTTSNANTSTHTPLPLRPPELRQPAR